MTSNYFEEENVGFWAKKTHMASEDAFEVRKETNVDRLNCFVSVWYSGIFLMSSHSFSTGNPITVKILSSCSLKKKQTFF